MTAKAATRNSVARNDLLVLMLLFLSGPRRQHTILLIKSFAEQRKDEGDAGASASAGALFTFMTRSRDGKGTIGDNTQWGVPNVPMSQNVQVPACKRWRPAPAHGRGSELGLPPQKRDSPGSLLNPHRLRRPARRSARASRPLFADHNACHNLHTPLGSSRATCRGLQAAWSS